MAHIVLLGDSIFDNKAYVGNEPEVIEQLRAMIPQNWQATLKAVDGSIVENVGSQMQNNSGNATHFIISAGGNNALMNVDVLNLKANSSAEVFSILANRIDAFEFNYSEMLKQILSFGIPTVVCTIYYPNFPESSVQKIAVAALCSFNDVIIRQAILAGVPILDLRLICNEKDDYANEIEPSSKGGRKITAKILEVVENHDFANKRTCVYF
jgi:hypothetical protein